jgi:hypothetical protein
VEQATALAPAASTTPAAANEPTPESEPAPPAAKAAPPAAKPSAPAAKTVVHDPGGPVEVAPTVEGLSRIGADKCKVCHKIQFESWNGSAHGKRDPPLDCEGCHGRGSGYKTIAVMKDPAKARAAGLVMPAKTFCETCHKSGWKDAMLTAAHAHKPE